MYNSVIECCKSIKYIYWVKKRLVWACLKGMILQKTLKEESSQITHYDDSYSAFHIRDARSPSLCIYLPSRSMLLDAALAFVLLSRPASLKPSAQKYKDVLVSSSLPCTVHMGNTSCTMVPYIVLSSLERRLFKFLFVICNSISIVDT